MPFVDASYSHPIAAPAGGLPPAPVEGTVTRPTERVQDSWTRTRTVEPQVESTTVSVGSDDICRVVDVADLQRGRARAQTSPVAAFLQKVLGYAPRVEALSHGEFVHSPASSGIKTNQLLSAADYCFQAHIPFGLRPEVLWFTILNQVATEVVLNPEEYQALFTTSNEKETLQVRHDGLRLGSSYGWDQAIGMFEEPLRGAVPPGIMDIALPGDMTTVGTNEGLGCLVAFMHAASPFYDYRVLTLCGIPSVALYGSAADWRNLSDRTNRIAAMFPAMAPYFDAIKPILSRLIQAADGAVIAKGRGNRWGEGIEGGDAFWKSIYKRNSGSGGDKLTGWLTNFYAFTVSDGQTSKRDRFLWKPGAQLNSWGGVNPCHFPSSISAVDFIWDYFGIEMPMKFVGGVLSTQEQQGFITPRVGWGVVHAQ